MVSGDGNRIDQSHTVNNFYYASLPETKPPTARRDRNETTLINAVWTEVEDRLRQSLHNAILIRLDLAEQRHQVSRPWDSQLRTASQGTTPLPPGTPIAEVFDRREVGGKLLILGHPGAGKTTTMLDLAATLIQRANDDPNEPIPVMVSLSSWQNPLQSLTDWLLGELRTKYGISPKLGQIWLAEKTLLPLFDGLDELPPQRQEPVVEQINDWLRSGDGPPRLLVCSRLEEYELYAAKLALNAAICLHPLMDAQVQAYLASLEMAPLWDTLQHDSDLLELVRTPLLLSVSMLANDAIDLIQWQRLGTTQERLDYLLDAYIVRRLHEPVKSTAYLPGKEPSGKQTRRWLVWLAKQLKAQSEDEFLIEKMQPSLLKQKKQYLQYLVFFLLLRGLPIALLFMIWVFTLISLKVCRSILKEGMSGLQSINIEWIISWSVIGFFASWLLGLIASLVIHFDSIEEIKFVEKIEFDFERIKNSLRHKIAEHSLFPYILKGALFGFLMSVSIHAFGDEASKSVFKETVIVSLPSVKLSGIYINGLAGGFLLGALFGVTNLVASFFHADIKNRTIPNQGIIQSIKNFPALLILTVFVNLFVFIFFSFLSSKDFSGTLPISLVSLILSPFLLIFSGGSLAAFQHCSLRMVLYSLGSIPWNYARFLNHCTDRLLLQRVGGRYRFIHRLVQEHFAAMPLEGRGGVDG